MGTLRYPHCLFFLVFFFFFVCVFCFLFQKLLPIGRKYINFVIYHVYKRNFCFYVCIAMNIGIMSSGQEKKEKKRAAEEFHFLHRWKKKKKNKKKWERHKNDNNSSNWLINKTQLRFSHLDDFLFFFLFSFPFRSFIRRFIIAAGCCCCCCCPPPLLPSVCIVSSKEK